MVTNSSLHYVIIKYIIDKGFAPNLDELAEILGEDKPEIVKGLYLLQEYHGVVLHPKEPKVWVIHPFSLAPTNFLVKSTRGTWWGNCAWCSLGVAALIKEDTTITTRIGAHDKQITIHIENGEVREKNLYIHFPIPMRKAWENVLYTCSTMLVFETEEQIDEWSTQHNIPKGDVQPISSIWEFSKKWYGNHLNLNWEKWTMAEAKAIFSQFDLKGEIWDLETSSSRF
jgi:hypothetical protein